MIERYGALAEDPEGARYHYHRGSELAKSLGYEVSDLETVPARVLAAFCGMGNPIAHAPLEPGRRVLDVGSGSGTDAFIAARHVGDTGFVTGVDLTPQMIDLSVRSAREDQIDNVSFLEGSGERLPYSDNAFDVVISNGVIHLCPDKERVLREMGRVLSPGGFSVVTDILIERIPPRSTRDLIHRWTKCVVGALTPDSVESLWAEAGLTVIDVIGGEDVFDGARGEANADHYGALGWTITSRAS